MSLKNYLNKLVEQGFLRPEKIGIDQVRALLESAEKNLEASQKTLRIDEETCFLMAYNSMLKIARALIFLEGFRPVDGQQHKTTIDVAEKILGREFKFLIVKFDKMRKKRNQFTYDPLVPLSKTEAKNAFETAKEFHKKTTFFLEKTSRQNNLFKK